jgi:DnaK suppressor protein
MDDKTRAELKEIITEAIKDIQNDIDYLEEATKPVEPDCSVGRLSRMDALGSKGVNEGLLENSKSKLSLLKKNLERAETDAFGTCVVCSKPIPIERLKALPETRKCVMCSQR